MGHAQGVPLEEDLSTVWSILADIWLLTILHPITMGVIFAAIALVITATTLLFTRGD